MEALRRGILVLCLVICSFGYTGTGSALTFNDHDYLVIKGIHTWEAANNYLPAGYHLATVTSMEEHNFIANSLLQDCIGEYWLGAYQDQGSDPMSGWHWVTDEPWTFENWAPGEANEWNGTLEDHLGMWSNYGWLWNDEHGSANIRGFIAESAPIPTPEPSSLLLLGTVLFCLTAVSRKKFKNR
jgi:PEP-CTERM motif